MHSLIKTVSMTEQPQWPSGEEPETIHGIEGAFTDGVGTTFAVPAALADCQSVSLRKSPRGWYWAGKTKPMTSAPIKSAPETESGRNGRSHPVAR